MLLHPQRLLLLTLLRVHHGRSHRVHVPDALHGGAHRVHCVHRCRQGVVCVWGRRWVAARVVDLIRLCHAESHQVGYAGDVGCGIAPESRGDAALADHVCDGCHSVCVMQLLFYVVLLMETVVASKNIAKFSVAVVVVVIQTASIRAGRRKSSVAGRTVTVSAR